MAQGNMYQNGVMQDCGFNWSPPDWLDLTELCSNYRRLCNNRA